MNYLLLEQVDSTNSYVSLHSNELSDMTMVMTATQTAGRGQRGNSWESESGKNLTFTLFHKPAGLEARDQFALSEAAALAVVDLLAENGVDARVKWPNDVYVGDRKIAGILIEHSVMGRRIDHSRIGVGLNVNQREFRSDAPNPVSIYQLTGSDTDLTRLSVAMGDRLEARLLMVASPDGREALHSEFLNSMWRADGQPYPFRRRADGLEFMGVIEGVARDGVLTLTDSASGLSDRYFFKEVEFLL